ncbi:MAG: hypothetical protein CL928_03260 [Deltaproteobacteria bacterium]|nr:hypothetical protein [Deltaproteobacteria bacterium]
MRILVPLILVGGLCLAACEEEIVDDGVPDWDARTSGVLVAGAAGGTLDLPVGTPLGGYTARDRSLGDESGPDTRDSDYRTDFIPSAGWQTRIPADVLYLENGEDAAAIVRFDLIYSFDGLTEALGEELSRRFDRDMTDSVFTLASHSHSSYGPFTKSTVLFFGGDFFRQEIFDRLVNQLADLAEQAFVARTEAAIGLGIDPNFDPIGEDQVFGDRRSENDHLHGPAGEPTGAGHKDARATLLRVDSVDGDPIAALFAFGIHGTVLGGGNPLVSTDAPGHISTLLQQRHGGPRWIFAQGAAGDVSPRGNHSGFAQLESVAENAVEGLVALYEATEVAAGEVELEPVQRYVRQGRDIRVTRNGAVDLHYMEWDPSWADDPYRPDLQVWDQGCDGFVSPDCAIRSPLDEFWAQHGAVLCGEPDIDIALFGLDVPLPMYASCLDVDKGYSLFRIAFRGYIDSRDDYPLPLPESRTAMLGALGIGSVPVTVLGEGGTQDEHVVFAFAPGEATTLWTQFLRHRARAEKGAERTVVLAYAMDHEGYLLTADDWLSAGYEPAIVWWGPLQGEYLLEQLLDVVELAHTPVVEDPAWPDFPTSTWYPDWVTPIVEPDPSPDAGTPLEALPDYLFVRDDVRPAQVQPNPTVERIQGIARFTFQGSDPATGLVSVELQREDETDGWVPVTTPRGDAVSDALPDILVTYTPDPLQGTDEEPDPVRTHLYHAEWQAVQTWGGLQDVSALPLGRYRLVASGGSRDPEDTAYPFDSLPWAQHSEPFEVTPAALDLDVSLDGTVATLRLAYSAAPRGYRLLHQTSGPNSPTPLVSGPGGIQVLVASESGDVSEEFVEVTGVDDETGTTVVVDLVSLAPESGSSWSFTVDDGHGNTATATGVLP